MCLKVTNEVGNRKGIFCFSRDKCRGQSLLGLESNLFADGHEKTRKFLEFFFYVGSGLRQLTHSFVRSSFVCLEKSVFSLSLARKS